MVQALDHGAVVIKVKKVAKEVGNTTQDIQLLFLNSSSKE